MAGTKLISQVIHCPVMGAWRPVAVCLMRCADAPCANYINLPQEAKQAAYYNLREHGHAPAMLPF